MSTVVMDQPYKHKALSLLFWGTESLFAQQVLSHLVASFAIQAVFLPARPEQLYSGQVQNPSFSDRIDKRSLEQVASPGTVENSGFHSARSIATAEDAPVQQLSAEMAQSSSDELPLVTPFITTTTLHTAWHHGLPVYALRTIDHDALRPLLQSLAPDLVCVACFPWRIPAELLAIPTYGFVNLHPSLLPAYRGPAPLFWQLRDGLQHSGVTLHRMDQRFDTGEILAQQSLPLIEGASASTLDRAYAQAGGALLTTFLAALARDGTSAIKGQPQVGRASKQSWPEAADFVLDPTWSARHAFNFMRGTAEWGHPYRITLAGRSYLLHSAPRYSATESLAEPVTIQAGELAIQFNPGVLYARGTIHQGEPLQ